jgi:hypothetical protein
MSSGGRPRRGLPSWAEQGKYTTTGQRSDKVHFNIQAELRVARVVLRGGKTVSIPTRVTKVSRIVARSSVVLLSVLAGCAATPDQFRQMCLEHKPIGASAGRVAEGVAGNVLTLGVLASVNNTRIYADCATILGDDQLRQSCPDRVALCEQFFAEQKARAEATRVNVTQINEQTGSPPLPSPLSLTPPLTLPPPQNINCMDTSIGINCHPY